MPITCSWYYYNNWFKVEIIKCEIKGYNFEHHAFKTHYDPIGVVDRFGQKFHTNYKLYSLDDIERYRNVHSDMEIQRIYEQLEK